MVLFFVVLRDRMILTGATMFLQHLKTYTQLFKNGRYRTYLDYHFAVTIPTHWDRGI